MTLKNSFGIANKSFGLRFNGEFQWFDILPKPDNEIALQNIYASIAKGN